MLTAEAGRETVVKIAKLGVRDYLIKPFKEELLIERVGRVVALNPKSEHLGRVKRFDDPINVLVMDDKPAIVEQIRTGLADTAWKISSADQPGQALDHCMKREVDVVLASLLLPKDGAHLLFQNLRGYASTATIPVFGLFVRTATAEQTRAQQAGFAGIITKPIDPEELKTKICRSLRLETSYKYFQPRNNVLVLTLPKEVQQAVAHEVSVHLNSQLTAAVDAGNDKLIIDLSSVATATLPLIELVISAIQASGAFSLKYAIVAPQALREECRSFEEAQSWFFTDTIAEALSAQPVATNN
jgi:two-component system cell cycle response regulator